MSPTAAPDVLVLDFDGVLCNPDDECRLVAWLAVHPPAGSAPVSSYLTAIAPGFTARFSRIRGYARLMEHFIVAHHPEADLVQGHADFAGLFESIPESEVAAFTQAATAARDRFRAEEPDCWLGMHPLYAGIADALTTSTRMIAVATARDAESAWMVLDHHGLRDSVVHVAGDCRDKAAFVTSLCRDYGITAGDVAFADDSIHNVLAVAATGARAYWAMWGHRVPEDLTTAREAGITRLELDELAWLAGS